MATSYSLINGMGKRLNARRFFGARHLRKVYKSEQLTAFLLLENGGINVDITGVLTSTLVSSLFSDVNLSQ